MMVPQHMTLNTKFLFLQIARRGGGEWLNTYKWVADGSLPKLHIHVDKKNTNTSNWNISKQGVREQNVHLKAVLNSNLIFHLCKYALIFASYPCK
jgi:hypothetical protein